VPLAKNLDDLDRSGLLEKFNPQERSATKTQFSQLRKESL